MCVGNDDDQEEEDNRLIYTYRRIKEQTNKHVITPYQNAGNQLHNVVCKQLHDNCLFTVLSYNVQTRVNKQVKHIHK